ncbi:MAG: hypothetical protein JW892_15935, partial [Anaerolineae bacterium]|nr:hypothetical protein [Anaerolineae bacterium]
LPVAMSNALELWQAPGDWRRGLRLMVLTAGLCLTHYIVAVMFACFLIAVVLYFRIGLRSSYRATSFRALLGWSMLSLGVAAPWILRVLQYASPRAIVSAGLFGALPSRDHLSYWWHLLNNARSWFLIGLATLAVTAFAFKRNKLTGLLLTWLIIMAMLFTEWPWQIPPFRPDLLLICAFLPINVMAAEGLDWLLQRFTWMPQPKARRLLTLGTWTVLLLWGGIDTATVINPQTLLATKADVTAIGWIQQNTPENARFLINVAPWQSDIYRGTDGGWWIPVLSDRETLLPPGIQYGHGNSDYKAAVKAMSEELLALHGCSQAFWHFALENHITHIYIGEEAGLLQPYWFDQCSGVHRIYLSEDVHIYEIPASQPLCCAYLESSACEENAFMLARFPAAFSKALLADGTSAPGSRHSMMDP